MLLFEEQMNENKHSTGSVLSNRIPGSLEEMRDKRGSERMNLLRRGENEVLRWK